MPNPDDPNCAEAIKAGNVLAWIFAAYVLCCFCSICCVVCRRIYLDTRQEREEAIRNINIQLSSNNHEQTQGVSPKN